MSCHSQCVVIDELSVLQLCRWVVLVNELSVDELAVDELAVDELAVDELAVDELAVNEFSPHQQNTVTIQILPKLD